MNSLKKKTLEYIKEGVLKNRMHCINFAIGWYTSTRKSIPFEYIDFIEYLYKQGLLEE